MNRRTRMAALLVAALSLVGCRAPYATRVKPDGTTETINVLIPDPRRPATATKSGGDQCGCRGQ